MGEAGDTENESGEKMIDWYAFWTGGPVRRFIFEHMKRSMRLMDDFFDSFGPHKHFW